jgi:hypothetical protein
LATGFCRDVAQEIFTATTVPVDRCQIRTPHGVSSSGGDQESAPDTADAIRF